MAPRNPAHIGPGGRGFFGTVTVGTRGQISIPAQARKSLGLEPGDQLVVLTDPAQGLALIPLSLLLAQHADPNPIAGRPRGARRNTRYPRGGRGGSNTNKGRRRHPRGAHSGSGHRSRGGHRIRR